MEEYFVKLNSNFDTGPREFLLTNLVSGSTNNKVRIFADNPSWREKRIPRYQVYPVNGLRREAPPRCKKETRKLRRCEIRRLSLKFPVAPESTSFIRSCRFILSVLPNQTATGQQSTKPSLLGVLLTITIFSECSSLDKPAIFTLRNV
jgi:hypothetical protein